MEWSSHSTFLRSNLGIDSPALLSSPFLLVVLAYFGHSPQLCAEHDEASQLRYWALMANAKGRFSRGSSETILDQDLASIRQGGAVSELIDRLRLQFGRLDITAGRVGGPQPAQCAVQDHVPGISCGRCQGLAQPPGHCAGPLGQSAPLAVSSHFPQGIACAAATPLARPTTSPTWLSSAAKTNRAISDKAPVTYLLPLVAQHGAAPFAAQCIPVEEELLALDQYKAFLQERRKRIAAALNAFIPCDRLSCQRHLVATL
jgi:hypothetical protein